MKKRTLTVADIIQTISKSYCDRYKNCMNVLYEKKIRKIDSFSYRFPQLYSIIKTYPFDRSYHFKTGIYITSQDSSVYNNPIFDQFKILTGVLTIFKYKPSHRTVSKSAKLYNIDPL